MNLFLQHQFIQHQVHQYHTGMLTDVVIAILQDQIKVMLHHMNGMITELVVEIYVN